MYIKLVLLEVEAEDDQKARVETDAEGVAEDCTPQYPADRGRQNYDGGDYLSGGGGGDCSDREGLES